MGEGQKYTFHWKREYSVIQGMAAVVGLHVFNYAKQLMGKDVVVRGEWRGRWMSVYTQGDLVTKILEGIGEELRVKPQVVENELTVLHQIGERLTKLCSGFEVSRDTSTEELLEMNKKFVALYEEYGPPLWYSFYLPEAAGSLLHEQILGILPGGDAVGALAELSVPSKRAHVMKIADYFRKEMDIEKRVTFVKKRYPWLGSADPMLPPWGNKQIRDYAQSFVVEEGEQLVGYNFEAKVDERILKLYREALYIKDKRDEYRRVAFYHIYPVYEELARRFGVEIDRLWYVMGDEMGGFIGDAGKLLDDIDKREKAFVVERNEQGIKQYEGERALEMLLEKEKEVLEELSGVAGSKGKLKGKVQIVTLDNLDKFRKGNVLVAVTTNPNYVPAMQRASAFVTDEGGITCHAAIVAREMNKPCVVGTKVATQVLKDGDRVEVDADKGIVKIL